MLCYFMMDEMAIRRQIDWDGKRFVGYLDMGVPVEDNTGLPVVHEALVFLIVSLTEHWKVPVGYFLIDGLGGSERANLVKLCLERLYDCGVRVLSLTFDGCRANNTMSNLLGASFDPDSLQPMFQHPSNPDLFVCIVFDACHMLKLMRNLLAEKKIILDEAGRQIKWSYIEELHKLQQEEGLRAGNKLHERHIEFKRQKMKVKLAAQTLSSSVANALIFAKTLSSYLNFRIVMPL